MKLVMLIVLALAGCASKEKESVRLPSWSVECSKLDGVKDGKYCIHTKGTPTRTVFYFHGAGCNQDVLQTTQVCIPPKEGKSEREFMDRIQNVTVVTISFGPIWLLDPVSPKTMANKDATVDKFVESILPELHRRHTLAKPWLAAGHSMGGFNAAQIALNTDLFSRVVLMHPMFPVCDLFSGEIINEDCWSDHMIKAEFPKKKWPQVNPLELMKTKKSPPTMVQVCGKDEFGLVDGPLLYAKIGMTRGFPVYSELRPDGCNHFEYNVETALLFLN